MRASVKTNLFRKRQGGQSPARRHGEPERLSYAVAVRKTGRLSAKTYMRAVAANPNGSCDSKPGTTPLSPALTPAFPSRRGTCFRCLENTSDWINASVIKPPPAGSVKVLAPVGEDLGEGER